MKEGGGRQQAEDHRCGCKTRVSHMNSHSSGGIQRHSMIRGPLPSCAGETRPPRDPPTRVCDSRGTGRTSRRRRSRSRHGGRLHLPSTHTRRHGASVRRGYVAGGSGLLTGFPPFITAGSLVLLLGGTAALGTVSPTSCNDGSRYMATAGAGRTQRRQRDE